MQTDPTWLVLFVVCSLATWRLTHLMVEEDGPFDLICRLRSMLGDSPAGRAMDCFYCSSLWLAMPMALVIARTPLDWLFAWLSLSGAASLLERMTLRAPAPSGPEGGPS
jgi:hypothetical protein